MMASNPLPATAHRVEQSTDAEVNQLIRSRTDLELERMEHAGPIEISERLATVGREWDVERVLQANAATLVLLGILLGTRADRRFLLLPAAVWGFLAQHALQGWCPPIPIIRRLGVRTMREIERERYALKAMRGDLDEVPDKGAANAMARAKAVLKAVDA